MYVLRTCTLCTPYLRTPIKLRSPAVERPLVGVWEALFGTSLPLVSVHTLTSRGGVPAIPDLINLTVNNLIVHLSLCPLLPPSSTPHQGQAGSSWRPQACQRHYFILMTATPHHP